MTRLEHVGIAVDDVSDVIARFEDLLGRQPYKDETVENQGVRTHFIDAHTAKLELLESVGDESPIRRFLDQRGEGLHHVAFEVADADEAMNRLEAAGFTLLSESPEAGADDKRIFFVHPKETHGVLVEFCESTALNWSPRTVSHREGRLSVFERGDPSNPTILFIHGAAGSTLLETAPLMKRLEPAFHTVGLDLGGHGSSTFPSSGPLRMETFVEDTVAALDAVDRTSAHIFGFSLGGAVALRLAQTYPECVDRLALFQTNARWPRDLSAQMKRRLELNRLRQRAPEQAERLESIHDEPNRLLRELRDFVETLPVASEPMWRSLSDVTAPTLVSSVDRDPLFGTDVPQTLKEKLPNARLAILPGEHHSLLDAPLSLLAPLVRDFFS